MPSKTHASSWPTWQALSDRPRLDSLKDFVERLITAEHSRISCIVLYGSMARGDWSRSSDFDVLIRTTSENEGRAVDRIQQFDVYSDGWVEAFSYSPRELELMFCSFNLVVLAALRDGVVLYDDGAWARYQKRYQYLLDNGYLIREDRGWRWTAEATRRVHEPPADPDRST